MNVDPIDHYFSDQVTPEQALAIAAQLADDPALADYFVEQAKLDMLLGEIHTDQRRGQFYQALAASMQPQEAAPAPVVDSKKVVRGPFPYWKQVAAVLVAGLLLWGMVGVWYGATQISAARRRPVVRPKVETAVAAVDGKSPELRAEDRALEAWLREYYVDAQPSAEQSLAAWMDQLVGHEFPLHNHTNKHRDLKWELRVKEPQALEKLAQQTLRLQFSPASILHQVQGLAALAGCEVHVETDKLVLTPIVQSATGMETKELVLSEVFARGAGPVATMVEIAMDDNVDRFIHLDSPAKTQGNETVGWTLRLHDQAPAMMDQLKNRILQCGINWPEGTTVGTVAQEEVHSYPDVSFMLPTDTQTEQIPTVGETDIKTWEYRGGIDVGRMVASPANFRAAVTSSPRGLRQLEILSTLAATQGATPNLQLTDYAFAVGTAPASEDRVISAEEIQATEATWAKTATVSTVGIASEVPAQPLALYFANGRDFQSDWVKLEQANDENGNGIASSHTLSFGGRLSSPLVSQANLTLTRSGEMVRISGGINHRSPQEANVFGRSRISMWPALTEPPSETVNEELVRGEIQPPAVPPIAPGVDISLALFKGQGAIVAGPVQDGKAHFYLLKWQK